MNSFLFAEPAVRENLNSLLSPSMKYSTILKGVHDQSWNRGIPLGYFLSVSRHSALFWSFHLELQR